MSHFTTLDKADIVSPKAFGMAMKDLGFTGELKEAVSLRGYDGTTRTADFAVSTGRYGVGLQKNAKGRFDMIADWWGVRGEMPQKAREMGLRGDNDLQDAILRHTTKHTIVSEYRRQGFMARVQEDEEHNMTVTLSRGG